MVEFGYAGKFLRVNLSSGKKTNLPTTDYSTRFLGGRGIAAKIHWDEVSPEIKPFDPENFLTFNTGPLAGIKRLAGSRMQICGKSPSVDPESFSYANIGGGFGAWLKFSGYDGVTIHGRSDKPVYLFIHDEDVEIRDASHLWGKDTFEVRETLKRELGKRVRVLAIGQAGENKVSFATLLADEDSSASSGFGSVMGSKNLKAIAVAGKMNLSVADPERLKTLTDHIYQLRTGTWDVYMPTIPGRTKRQICYGCIAGCMREVYTSESGEKGKFFCQAADTYRKLAMDYYGGWTDVIFQASRLCDRYGLDTNVLQPMIVWLFKCHEEGILSEAETGLPLSKIGSYEFIENLIRKISLREGFGNILANGTIKAAEVLGQEAVELIGESIVTKTNEMTVYDPRLYIITGLLYAMEQRKPIQQIHEISTAMIFWLQWVKGDKVGFLSTEILRNIARKYWGSEEAVDFSTYEGKALAAKKIQDRSCVKESLILCDYLWPIAYVRNSENHMGDPGLESQVFSAVTGKETNEEELNSIGERIFNLQRAILTREGRVGRDHDNLLDFFYKNPLNYEHFNRKCLVPGKNGEIISRKGEILEREKFENMKSEYYEIRKWDIESGLQTADKLAELDLEDVSKDLEERGFITKVE